MTLRRALPILTVLLLSAGCASEAVEPPGLEATVAAEPTPTPSPTPAGAVLEPSDPDLGIVFEDVPQLEGEQVDVYNTVAAYQKEYWRMMTTNTVSPGFDVLASPEIRAMMQRIATQNAEAQAEIKGVFHTRISDVVVDGGSATALVCDDYRDVLATDPNGSYTAEEVGLEDLAARLTLGPSGMGTWVALESVPAGAC